MEKKFPKKSNRIKRVIREKWQKSSLPIKLLIIFMPLIAVFIYTILRDINWLSTLNNITKLILAILVSGTPFLESVINIINILVNEDKKERQTLSAFELVTENAMKVLEPKLRGIPHLIPREETTIIQVQFNIGIPVLLTGEAGTGKTGVGIDIVKKAKNNKIITLLIDARRLTGYQNFTDLEGFFGIKESVFEAINRISETYGLVVVVDQIDNIASSPEATLTLDFLIGCSRIEHTNVLAISRFHESNEHGVIKRLLDVNFINIECNLLDPDTVKNTFEELGVQHFSIDTIKLSRNILNLDLICEIVRESGNKDISNIHEVITLWEKYRNILHDREEEIDHNSGNKLIAEAVRLATIGLCSIDRGFILDYPLTSIQDRLISWNVITRINEGDKIQFRHDQLQDYLFAWMACNRERIAEEIYQEIGILHSRNIILWMRDIYMNRGAEPYRRFLEESLNG